MSSVSVSETVEYDVTVDFSTDGVQCIVWRKPEDEDFIDVVVPFDKMIEQLVDYNTTRGHLNPSGLEEVIQVRDTLQAVVLKLNDIIVEGSLHVK